MFSLLCDIGIPPVFEIELLLFLQWAVPHIDFLHSFRRRSQGVFSSLRMGFTRLFDIKQIIRHICYMHSTVTELLRDFPRVKRAVLAGEAVIIKSREGNFRLTLDTPVAEKLVGCLKGFVARVDDDIDGPTSSELNWESRL